MNRSFVGVDFGRSQDYTAIAVLERAETTGEWDPGKYAWRKLVSLQLRYLKRVERGTPYPEVVRRVCRVTRSGELAGRCTLTADGTGVGRAVVDLLRNEGPGCPLYPVNITGGLQETFDGEYHGVPKRDLILGLQVLLQQGLLQIASGLEYAQELVKEMTAMQVKISLSGQELLGAWREGTHDDMVFAVALAYWNAKKMYPKAPVGAAQWWTNSHEAEAARVFKKVLKV